MAVSIKVLFFGAAADAAGTRQSVFEATGETVGIAVGEIVAKYDKLSSLNLIFAVNESYADGAFRLKNGDELALFTAVSGG